MSFRKSLRARAAGAGATLVFPEGEDPRVQAAAATPAAPINTVRSSTSASVQPTAQKPEEKNIGTLSIVNQIDTVVPTRLMNTKFAKSGIRLQESVQGGVEVYVGLQKFSTVDDVPDEAIKSEIRAAIAEWEEKYTPGM